MRGCFPPGGEGWRSSPDGDARGGAGQSPARCPHRGRVVGWIAVYIRVYTQAETAVLPGVS